MKRDPQLQDLSRDHHHALVLARKAQTAASQATQEELDWIWDRITHSFHQELEPHFEVEEQCLLPGLEVAGEHALVQRTLSDHQQLRAMVSGPQSRTREALLQFAELLTAHVRFEERQLFATAQATLRPEQLQEIAERSAALESALRRRSSSTNR